MAGRQFGDDAPEVQQIFPGVTRDANPGHLINDATEDFAMDTQAATHAAHVNFYFREGHLFEVLINITDLSSGSTSFNMEQAKELSALVSRKYGEPYNCEISPSPVLSKYECDWIQGERNISVLYMDVAGDAVVLNVAYKGNAHELGNNL